MVGAVLARDDRIVGRGYHSRFGGSHAEIQCIRNARGRVAGATLYVNLEPCSHYGQTPPCVDAIIAARIRNVVVAMVDPNPLVAGRGIRKLRSAGVTVSTGTLKDEAAELNRFFLHHVVRRSPYVHVKIAESVDGMIAPHRGASRWLTSRASKKLVHQWRAEHDAVLVGAGTIIADNPRLTTRLVRGRDPAVVILDGALRVPLNAKVFTAGHRRRVIVCTSMRAVKEHETRARRLAKLGVFVLPVASGGYSLSLRLVLRMLYKLKIGSVLVEGGQLVFTSFLREGLADEVSVFVAPVVLGNGVPALKSGLPGTLAGDSPAIRRVGRDILFSVRKI